MHAALQSARNQSSLETPLKAEELLSAHFNLAVLEDQTIKHTIPDAEKSPDNDQNTEKPQFQHQTTRLTSRFRVATLRIVLQGDRTPTGAVAPTCRCEFGLVKRHTCGL